MKNSFCSSPWFHIGINPEGVYLPCRWSRDIRTASILKESLTHNMRDMSLIDFMNSDQMKALRLEFLNGVSPKMCRTCVYEDSHSKVSGRQRQLLKSGITIGNFDKTFCASPHYDWFEHSQNNEGHTNTMPVDLQIELGNTCNSGCIMCFPIYSSKLASDYKKLHLVEPTLFPSYAPFKNWADDPTLVDKFISDLEQIPNIRYIHFLGGETLYLKSFYAICERLIQSGLSKNISMGTTTNCTIYTPELEYIIRNFKHVHLGLSIESFHPINDYIRHPSQIDSVTENIHKFLALREETGMHLALRISPSVLSIFYLDTVFKFMIEHSITAESCDILTEPSCLRMELIPDNIREICLSKINAVIDDYNLERSTSTIVNRRNDSVLNDVISELVYEYRDFLLHYHRPPNVEADRNNLVKFLKSFESIRGNNILDYLPEYEKFLRLYGY
jgi:Iron-sulfur cluster-binding domain